MNNNEESSLIDKIVEFSVTKEIISKGIILDKIDMKDKPDKDNFTVTGYLIEDITGKIHSISYWRILKIHSDMTIQQFFDSAIPKGEILGGYNREQRKQN